MFCINCGQQLPENATFCSRCGTKVFHIPSAESLVDEVEKNAENLYINDHTPSSITDYLVTPPSLENTQVTDQLRELGLTVIHTGSYLWMLKNRAGLLLFFSPIDNNFSEIYEDAGNSNYEGLASVKKNGYWGAIDRHLKMVVPAIYEYIWTFFEGHAVVKKAGKYGVVNTKGEILIPIQYDRIELKNNGIVMVSCNGMDGVMNLLGEILIPFRKYQGRWASYEGFSCVKYNDRYGYISDEGYEIPCVYKKATYSFSEGFAVVTAENGELRTIDRYGNYADGAKTKPYFGDWSEVGCFHDGVAYINNGDYLDGKRGVIDTNANTIIDFEYSRIYDFDKGYAIVYQNDKAGIINTQGKVVVKPIYKNIGWSIDVGIIKLWDTNAHNNILVCSLQDKEGIIDIDGNIIVDLIYDRIDNFNEGYACVKRNDKFGYIDIDGRLVMDTTFDYAGTFHNGGSPAVKSKFLSIQIGFIDYDGRFIVSWNKKRGFWPERWLGQTGVVGDLSTDKMGLIDNFGRIIIPLIYDEIKEQGNALVVKKQGQIGILDKFGNEIIPLAAGYDEIFISDGVWSMRKNGSYGFYDDTFKMITPHLYENKAWCNRFRYGFATVCVNNRRVLIDKNGVEFEDVKGYDAGVNDGSRKPWTTNR